MDSLFRQRTASSRWKTQPSRRSPAFSVRLSGSLSQSTVVCVGPSLVSQRPVPSAFVTESGPLLSCHIETAPHFPFEHCLSERQAPAWPSWSFSCREDSALSISVDGDFVPGNCFTQPFNGCLATEVLCRSRFSAFPTQSAR